MIRGTTPTLEFELPFSVSDLSEMYISLAQKIAGVCSVIVDIDMARCTCAGNVVSVKLTQEETLKLSAGRDTEIQIRAKTVTGDAIASDIITVPTDRILKDGVI
jgi:hypothetical protein